MEGAGSGADVAAVQAVCQALMLDLSPHHVPSLGTGSLLGKWIQPVWIIAWPAWTYSSAKLHLQMQWPFWLQKVHPSAQGQDQKKESGASF